MKAVNEISTNRLLKHFSDASTLAVISTYRTERTESENLALLRKFKFDVRAKKLGFTEFVSRWSEQDSDTGEVVASDEHSLAVYGIELSDAMGFGKEFHQSSIIFKDDVGCKEICTTPFVDYDGNKFNVGDVVREFHVDGNTPFNLRDAEDIFAKRKGGPASKPIKGNRAFRLNEVSEVEPVRSSSFATRERLIPLFKMDGLTIQIVNETIDGSIQNIVQLKTLDSSLEYSQMYDALEECPKDFQRKLIGALNSIGQTNGISPVDAFNMVMCASNDDNKDVPKKMYNWWRGVFEVLSRCDIPSEKKSEYDGKIDALIAEISKSGDSIDDDNSVVLESDDNIGYEQASKDDENKMLGDMKFAISKIGEIANKVQDLINFINPYCNNKMLESSVAQMKKWYLNGVVTRSDVQCELGGIYSHEELMDLLDSWDSESNAMAYYDYRDDSEDDSEDDFDAKDDDFYEETKMKFKKINENSTNDKLKELDRKYILGEITNPDQMWQEIAKHYPFVQEEEIYAHIDELETHRAKFEELVHDVNALKGDDAYDIMVEWLVDNDVFGNEDDVAKWWSHSFSNDAYRLQYRKTIDDEDDNEYLNFVDLLKDLSSASLIGFNDGDKMDKVDVIKQAIADKDMTSLNRLLILANANNVDKENPIYSMIDKAMGYDESYNEDNEMKFKKTNESDDNIIDSPYEEGEYMIDLDCNDNDETVYSVYFKKYDEQEEWEFLCSCSTREEAEDWIDSEMEYAKRKYKSKRSISERTSDGEWVSVDSIIDENNGGNDFKVGDKVIWNDPDGEPTSGWTIIDIDEEGVYGIEQEDGSFAEVLEDELELDGGEKESVNNEKKFKGSDGDSKELIVDKDDDSNKKIVKEMRVSVDIDDVGQLQEYLWGQGKSNLDELLDSKVASPETIMSIVEDMIGNEEPPTLTSINDLFAYDFEAILEPLGVDVEHYRNTLEIVKADDKDEDMVELESSKN